MKRFSISPNLELLRKIGEETRDRYKVSAPRGSAEVQDLHALLHYGFIRMWGRAERDLPDDEDDHIEAQITERGIAALAVT